MSVALKINYQTELELLRSSAVAAGIVALGYFRRDIKNWTKENSSPVTEADFLVDELLCNNLLSARPSYGWLSEESGTNDERIKKEYCFIVDPIDGTRAFLRGDDCWSISLAIVKNGEPIAGVIYAPAKDELYEAAKGCGAFLNGQPLKRKKAKENFPIIPAAPAVYRQLEKEGLNFIKAPSYPSLAYRLVQVATNRLDVAIARRGSHDWDIAAADIILRECKIELIDVCLGKPKYNKAELKHGALAAFADMSIKETIIRALKTVYGCKKSEKSEQINNE